MSDAQTAEQQDTNESDKKKSDNSDKNDPNPSSIDFNADIQIHPIKRIPSFDRGPVKAYAATGSGKVSKNLFALICEDELTPRAQVSGNYAKIINPNLAKLVASGTVFWPQDNKEKYCFIYEDTLGEPLLKDDVTGGLGWSHEVVMANIIKPMVSAMMDMRDKDVVHGAIRPCNMFDGGVRPLEKVILGDCLALPASYHMHALYEPIERAITNPLSRGVGTHEDDVYSFGVSLAIILRTNDPLHGLSEEQIIEQKMELGTYQALTGKDRFTGAILELLRGLLYDDRGQRWTLDEVQAWMDGRRLSPKQASKKSKANRPITFNAKKYVRPELLAKDLHKNPSEASRLVQSSDLMQWVERALEDKPVQSRVEQAIEIAADSARGSGYDEKLATRLSVALDPDAPIRHQGTVFMPDGLGHLLVQSYIQKKDLQVFVDIFNDYFAMQWVDMQINAPVDTGALISKFDSCRSFIRQTNIGYGLERTVYYLNTQCQCLSDKLKKFYVRTPEALMHAYEKIASSPDRPHYFFDRHIVAFLSVKDRKNIDPYLHELNSSEDYKKVLGELKTLATIQKRSRMEKFPAIANWIAQNLDPVYLRFHDRDLRESVKKKVQSLKKKGDLAKIAALFDDNNLYEGDMGEFRRAMQNYHKLRYEAALLEKKLEKEGVYGKETAHQAAALFSTGLAIIVIIVVALMAFADKGLTG